MLIRVPLACRMPWFTSVLLVLKLMLPTITAALLLCHLMVMEMVVSALSVPILKNKLEPRWVCVARHTPVKQHDHFQRRATSTLTDDNDQIPNTSDVRSFLTPTDHINQFQ